MKELFPHGRILLSSPIASYDVTYSINAWMHPEKKNVDRKKAIKQWHSLRNVLSRLGAYVEIVDMPGHPDSTFVANAGLVHKRTFILSSFKHPERQAEEEFWEKWARKVQHPENETPIRLFKAIHILNSESFEGAGDALFVEDLLCCGYGFRSTFGASQLIKSILGVEVLPLKLSNPQFYHLDTCFCPLNGREVMYFPGAFANHHAIEDRFDVIRVGQADAGHFACNSVVLGKDVIIPKNCVHTMSLLRSRGYTCHPVDMSEFLKSGGACKCLTLKYH